MVDRPTLILTGPTASGKGEVAFLLAKEIGGEIISLDSMKVYKELDIGTAKPSPEKRSQVAYHLIDLVYPNEEFSLGEYVRLCLEAVEAIKTRGHVPILAGGTPLYLWALVRGFCAAPPGSEEIRAKLRKRQEKEGLSSLYEELCRIDPEAARKIHPNDRKRIFRALEVFYQSGKPFSEFWRENQLRLPAGSFRIFGLRRLRGEIYERIGQRVDLMVKQGLFEEAERVWEEYAPLSKTARECIGYRQIWDNRTGGLSREEVIALIKKDTRHFARKQLTWFRRFPEIGWIEASGKGPAELAQEIGAGFAAAS